MFVTVSKNREVNANLINEVIREVETNSLVFKLSTGEVVNNVYSDLENLNHAYEKYRREAHMDAYAIDRIVFALEDIKDFGIAILE